MYKLLSRRLGRRVTNLAYLVWYTGLLVLIAYHVELPSVGFRYLDQ